MSSDPIAAPVSAAEPSAFHGPIDFDLPCGACGYNLRALSGDPLICPECGHRTPLLKVELSRQQVEIYRSRMESSLSAACGWFVAAAVCAALILILVLRLPFVATPSAGLTIGGGALLVIGVGTFCTFGVAARRHFISLCFAAPIASATVAEFVRGTLLLALLAMSPCGALWLLQILLPGPDWREGRLSTIALATVGAFILIVILLRVLVKPAYQRLLASLPAMNPEQVRRFAHEARQRELSRRLETWRS